VSDHEQQPSGQMEDGNAHTAAPSHANNDAHTYSHADPALVSRRWMLLKAGIALNGLVGLVLAVPIVRYLFAPWRKDSSYDSWISLGSANDFPAGETRLAFYKNPYTRGWDGATDNVACYVRRESADQFSVFAINCAHLGCPVRWFPQSQLFMCPCHGGVYYSDGSRASGPPERGLFTYAWKIDSGNLQIDAGQMPTLSNTARLVQISINKDGGKGDCSCQG
jgi:nitrite reductase/ring-hydroxylating ferredoxin subunit